MSATVYPPSKKVFTVRIEALTLVHLRGEIVKPFMVWYGKQTFYQEMTLSVGPEQYKALFHNEAARRIGKWAARWAKENSVSE